MSQLKDSQNPSGPVVIGKLKVTVDRNICIGASTCVAIASKTFELDTEAKAVILNSAGQDPEEIVLNAAKVCPVAAITIENEKGEKVYPK